MYRDNAGEMMVYLHKMKQQFLPLNPIEKIIKSCFIHNYRVKSSYFVINVRDVHCIQHIKVEVIFEYSPKYVEWNVRPKHDKINHSH